jgi:hypothetical protein
MLTAKQREQALPLWAGLVSFVAVYFLTLNVWKALVLAVFVCVSAMLGYGARWVLTGSFVIALVAIAVAFGLPRPDHWPQVVEQMHETVFHLTR